LIGQESKAIPRYHFHQGLEIIQAVRAPKVKNQAGLKRIIFNIVSPSFISLEL